jgi:hypothetical protein
MRFVPALRLSLALGLPTTANAKGRHGGPSHAHSPGHVTSNSSSAVPHHSYGTIKRTPAARFAVQHQNLFTTTFRPEQTP